MAGGDVNAEDGYQFDQELGIPPFVTLRSKANAFGFVRSIEPELGRRIGIKAIDFAKSVGWFDVVDEQQYYRAKVNSGGQQ